MDHDLYFIGITQQLETGGLGRLSAKVVKPACEVYPTGRDLLEFAGPIMAMLGGEAAVVRCLLGAVLGRYGLSQELSVGLEVTAAADFPVADFAIEVFSLAREASQRDAFVARMLPPDEWADNTRPGLTVVFKEPQRIGSLRRLRDQIASFPGDGWPIDGFTTIPTLDGSVGWVAGLRYIFLPEISLRWDLELRRHLTMVEDAMDIILLDQATKIGRLCRTLEQDPLVEQACRNWFDVIVGGIEDYDPIIGRLRRGSRAVADETSMSRKPFSELLDLTNQSVLAHRLGLLAESDRRA